MYNCKFCGKECKNKNSLVNHERFCKENPDRKISPFVKYNMERDKIWNKGLSKETDERVFQGAETLKKAYKEGKLISPNKGKHHTDEQKRKISEKRKEYLRNNPDKVPYLLNHSSNISYPEQYFIEIFSKEKIDLKYHKQIGIYQLDFYNEDLKIFVEIDGEQHYQEKSQKRDKIRDEYFRNLGWKGIRIRWSEYQKKSLLEKQKDIEKIKALVAQLVP